MRALTALTLSASAAMALPASAPAARVWNPGVKAARAYAEERPGEVSFSLRVGDRVYGHRADRVVPAMSLMKPMLMAAYLRRPEVRRRRLTRAERRMLGPMIRRSDSDAASQVLRVVGLEGERALARRVGMRDFVPFDVWGASHTSARDQSLLFWRLRRVLPRRHRPYAMRLLRRIVPAQRWGIARAAPRGWRLHFKGGWGSGSGAASHQAALLTRGRRRVALAITTTGNGSHAVSEQTLRGVARRLLRGLQ